MKLNQVFLVAKSWETEDINAKWFWQHCFLPFSSARLYRGNQGRNLRKIKMSLHSHLKDTWGSQERHHWLNWKVKMPTILRSLYSIQSILHCYPAQNGRSLKLLLWYGQPEKCCMKFSWPSVYAGIFLFGQWTPSAFFFFLRWANFLLSLHHFFGLAPTPPITFLMVHPLEWRHTVLAHA